MEPWYGPYPANTQLPREAIHLSSLEAFKSRWDGFQEGNQTQIIGVDTGATE